MKIVNINSGIGNQMFQAAFYLSLRNKFKSEVIKIDTSWYEVEKFHNGFELSRVFNIDFPHSTKQENEPLGRAGYTLYDRIKRKFLPSKKTEVIESKEQLFRYNPDLYGKNGENNYYRGYWQSYKYFDSISEIVKECFIFPPFTENNNIIMKSYIENNRSKTVSIHVRRGDYLNQKLLSNLCSTNYYQNAIAKIENKIKNPVYIIFSDDIQWCKENLDLSNVKFIDWNIGDLSFRDMQMMSMCDHNIIANSSFSWWGAYLNSNEGKTVIAPKDWFIGNETMDLIPIEWERV